MKKKKVSIDRKLVLTKEQVLTSLVKGGAGTTVVFSVCGCTYNATNCGPVETFETCETVCFGGLHQGCSIARC